MNILSLAPTTPIATALIAPGVVLNGAPRNLTAQLNFAYGSGGTSLDVYLQTSLDGGATWADIANFHVTTASVRKAINLNGQTPVTTQVPLTDGAIAANTAQDGLLGPRIRAKVLSAGTYVGTTVTLDLQSDQLPA